MVTQLLTKSQNKLSYFHTFLMFLIQYSDNNPKRNEKSTKFLWMDQTLKLKVIHQYKLVSNLPNTRGFIPRMKHTTHNKSDHCFYLIQNSQILGVCSQESSLYLPINQSLVFSSIRTPKYSGFTHKNHLCTSQSIRVLFLHQSELLNIQGFLTRIIPVPPNQSESCFYLKQNSQIFRVFSPESKISPISSESSFYLVALEFLREFNPKNSEFSTKIKRSQDFFLTVKVLEGQSWNGIKKFAAPARPGRVFVMQGRVCNLYFILQH